MTPRQSISTFFSRLAISATAIACTTAAAAQGKLFSIEKDSVPLFCGVAVSADLVGPAMLAMGSYGEYEAAIRANLHNQYFPIVEVGYGKANHENDEVTGLTYKTKAPYFRIGCDLNLLRNKMSANRLYAGVRYAFTSYKADIARTEFDDPVWGWGTSFQASGEQCNQHWVEAVLGLDTKLAGPLHIGWNVRYKRRISHKDPSVGSAWYVPGFGKQGDTRISANFNVIIDI